MKENSIEEDIVLLKEMQQNCLTKKEYKDSKANKKAKAIEHILSDYKRVLKENEELKKSKTTYEKVRDIQEKNRNIVDNKYISKQKVKDKIEELNRKINNGGKTYGRYGGCVINSENIMKLQNQIEALKELLEGRK
ncbi:hypothetical protein [Gemella morbillorum]